MLPPSALFTVDPLPLTVTLMIGQTDIMFQSTDVTIIVLQITLDLLTGEGKITYLLSAVNLYLISGNKRH